MDSSLRPRDIQARIRAGASPEDVAQAAGVPVERIDAFAAPVMAERDYIAGLARTNPVRRRGETTSHRALRNAVTDALTARGVDAESARWDAWKVEGRRWQVRITFTEDSQPHEALFTFDAMGRFSVAADDEARSLIGDEGNDQWAMVEATLAPVDQHGPVDDPIAAPQDDSDDSSDTDDDEDDDDAYGEGDLREVDGVYDLVPPERGDLDVLYDMLSSFDEDSVKIYAGLVHPKESSDESASSVVIGAEAEEITIEVTPDAQATEAHPAASEDADESSPANPSGEPEQLSLLDEPDPTPRPKTRSRRKRASVPTWDEIMFGAPQGREHDQ